MNSSDHNLKRLYILTPLFLLILLMGAINLAPRLFKPVETSATTPTPPVAVLSSPAAAETVFPTPLPTPTVASPTPQPTATLPANAVIQLLGPPINAVFAFNTPVTFYWQWQFPLTKEQQFVVYLLAGGQSYRLGAVNEANLGRSYRLQTTIEPLAETAETTQWLVQLETVPDAFPLLQSETRPISFQAAP